MKVLFTLLTLLFLTAANAQVDQIDILNEFVTTKNDSAFLTKYSKQPFQRYSAEQTTLPHTFDPIDSTIFYHHNKGDILGPYYLDSFVIYLKVTAVDSLIRMKAGNIWLNPETRGKDSIKMLAAQIVKNVSKTGDYNAMCMQYNDDKNRNYDCSLEWFFQGAMVSEFEKEVIHRKKGEIFIVPTQFGLHVVKILENPVLDRARVEFVMLYFDRE